MNIQAQNFQTGQRLTAKDLNDLKNAVMNPNISLGDGLVGSSGNGSISIQKSESLEKKAKEYTNTVWQLKSAPSQRFIHEDSDGNRYPSLFVYVGSTLANAFENINIQNQWIAQGTKPMALFLLNGKESPKCTTYLAEVDEKGAITKGDEVDISLDTAASQTEIDLQSDFYAKDRDIGIDGWLELPVAIVDATGTYMCVFEQGPMLVVGLFFCDLMTQKNVYNEDEQLSASYISYEISPNIVEIIEGLIGSTNIAAYGGMVGNPVPMFSCRPLTDYETLKPEFLDKDMVVDFDTFKIVSQFKNVQQFQFIDTVSQMPYAFKPVFVRAATGDAQEQTHVNFGWVLNLTVPEVEAPSSYDIDGILDNKYQSKFKQVNLTEDLIIKTGLGGSTFRYVDRNCVVKCEQIGVNGSSMYIGVLNNSEDEDFPAMTMSGTPFGKMPICLGGGLDAIILIADPTSPEYWLPIDDRNSKTVVLKCVPVWCPELGDYIYAFYSEITSTDSLNTYWVGTLNGVAQRENIVAALLPNSQKKWVESSALKNDEQILFNIGFNDNIRFRPLTPAYQTVDLRNIAATMPYTDAMYIDGKGIRENIIKDVGVQSAKNYALLASEYAESENQQNDNQYESRTGSISYKIEETGNADANKKFAIQLMGFGQDMPISVVTEGASNYGQDRGNISSIINNDFVIRHYLFDEPGELSSNNTHAVIDYVNMKSLLSAWTELCCQTSVDISAITDAVLSADNADWQNRYFLKCRVNDDPEDSNYGKVQVFLGKTTSRLDAHCTVGGMPVNYYRDKNGNTLTSDDKGWCTLPYSPGSKLYYWIGAEWDSGYSFYKYTFYITDVQMIPSNTGKDIVREEGFLYYQNANPNAYAYDLADYTTTGDVRKTNIDDASTWANRIYNIHLGDIHCNPFPDQIEPFTFGLGRDGYWKVYEGGDYLVYYNNEPISKHGSMLAVSTPPYGYNSGDGWADTNIPLTADVNLYFVFSNGSGSSQSIPEWDFVNGYPMPFSNGIRLVAGSDWDGNGIPMEITHYHKGKIFIDYVMGDYDFADYFNPSTKCYSIVRNIDKNDHFTLYQFENTTPTMSPITLQWSDTDPEDILSSNHFLVKNTTTNNTLEYLIPLIDAGRVNDLSAAIDELSGSVPTPGDIEQLLNQLSADILDSTDGKYWHLGNSTTSEAYGSVIGNSNQDTVIDLDHLTLDGSDWTVSQSLMVNNDLTVHNNCNLQGTLYYETYEWEAAPITIGNNFMEILVAADYGDPETILNAIQSGIESATAWSNAVVASSYGTFQGVLNAIGNAAQAAQNAQNAANAAQGAANAAQADVNALSSQINGANGIDARLSAAESNITSLDTRYNLLSGDVDTIGNQLTIQGQAIHDIADAISGDIVPAINGISSVVNNNVTQITNIDGRVTNIENNYTTVTNNISNLSTDVGTLSSGLSSAQSNIDSINQNKADLSALNDLSDSLSNYVEKYTTEVQTISTPLINLQPLSAFELNAAYGIDSQGMSKPYGTVTLNNSSGDKTTLYPARTIRENVGGRMRQVYHNPEIASYQASTSATYTLKVPYENGTIATKENLSAELSVKADLSSLNELSDSLSNYLSVETDPIFTNWKDGEFIEAGLSAQTSAYVSSTLPYDAELEYIEKTSTSESYFDTGFTPLWNDKIQSKWSINENKTVFFYMARQAANQPSRGFLKLNSNNNSFRADRTNGTASVATNFSANAPGYTLGTWFEAYDDGAGSMMLHGLYCGYNGTPNTGTSGTIGGTLRLFSGVGGNSWSSSTRFAYMRIFSGAANEGTAVCKLDLIPVRVGNVAYIYDRISKTLISRSGADDYVCGPDKRRTAVAVGSQAGAEEGSVAMGSTANAVDSIVNKFGSVAIGDGTKATNGIAIGSDTEADGSNFNIQMQAVAIGKSAYAKGASIAIGTNAVSGKSTGTNACQSIAIGRNSGPRDDNRTGVINIGYNNTHPSLGNNAIAIGSTVGATGSDGVVIGRNSQQSGSEGVAVGYNANANGLRAVSIGCYSKGTASEATALGHNAEATGTNSLALGYNAKASQNYSTAVGQDAKTTGSSGTGAVAFGSGAQANSNGGVALGGAAAANYDTAIAIGKYVETNAVSAITIGGTTDSNNHITNALSGSVQFWNWTAFKRNSNDTNLILDPERLQMLGGASSYFTPTLTKASTITVATPLRLYYFGNYLGLLYGKVTNSAAIAANSSLTIGTVTLPSGFGVDMNFRDFCQNSYYNLCYIGTNGSLQVFRNSSSQYAANAEIIISIWMKFSSVPSNPIPS